MSQFDVDLVTGPRRSARVAWIVASLAIIVAALSLLALVFALPLKNTEVFTVLVDSTTGATERVYQVEPTNIDDQRAVQEALIVAYVTDRESYFRSGIQARLESVQRRSVGRARSTLTALWSRGNANYPPEVYGVNSQVDVRILSINMLEGSVAQVRFEKRLQRPNAEAVTQPFVAIVDFDFQPRQERALERVWENPLGFVVTNYRITAETLGN